MSTRYLDLIDVLKMYEMYIECSIFIHIWMQWFNLNKFIQWKISNIHFDTAASKQLFRNWIIVFCEINLDLDIIDIIIVFLLTNLVIWIEKKIWNNFIRTCCWGKILTFAFGVYCSVKKCIVDVIQPIKIPYNI